MNRKIITIDDEKCNGCGNCVSGCAEGALHIVNGKARLVKELFCDGFGDCIKECPTGALKIVEREADDFDIEATRQHLAKTQGVKAVQRMEKANQAHMVSHPPHDGHGGHAHGPGGGGCPGSRMRFKPASDAASVPPAAPSGGHVIASDLQQWPVQLHLVQPGAPFFSGRELVVLSTCSPVASADVHWRFMRGRAVVVACPKLDRTDPYAEKLGAILSDPSIPKVIVVRMEVPCCGGLSVIARQAVQLSGRKNLKAEEATVSLDGDVIDTQPL